MRFKTLSILTLALLAGQALAENVSVRIQVKQGRNGLVMTPVHAQTGQFGLTPTLPEHATGARWWVLAKDKNGVVLHRTAVANGMLRQVETFDPRTGAVAYAGQIVQDQAVFEVSLPWDSRVQQIEVRGDDTSGAATGSGNASARAGIDAGGPDAGLAANGSINSVNSSSNISNSSPSGINSSPSGINSGFALGQFERSALQQLVTASTLAAPSLATKASATTIIETGPANARMDYVFVGDGYTAAEMDKWRKDAKKVIDGFMADPLFAANRGALNVRRVDVASNHSGADEPDRGIYRDTAMDSAFNCAGIARLLCVNSGKVLNVVGSVLAPDARDVIVVVTNSTRYGGSGGDVAALSMASQSIEIALHEIGHTAFSLADEYTYGTCSTSREPAAGNVSLNGSRSVKWGRLIASNTAVPTPGGNYANGTVGAFVGGDYCASGKYRPTENSRMRTLGYPWHAVNEGLARNVFAKYGSGPSDGNVITQTGSLASGGAVNVPGASPGYVTVGSGKFSVSLAGPAGADFDLFLNKWNGSSWATVASGRSSGPNETINYDGTAGSYYIRITAVSGSGNYTLKYSVPK